jgi:hypothetical protein
MLTYTHVATWTVIGQPQAGDPEVVGVAGPRAVAPLAVTA